MGGPLFHRERANTHLSELGRMVKPYLEQVYGQMQEAKRQALEFTKLKKTTSSSASCAPFSRTSSSSW